MRKSQLSVVKGPDRGAELELRENPVRIGSDPACDLVLANDSAVSGLHFEIRPTAEGFVVCDLGSTNGTYVEGLRVQQAYLPPRAQISAGDSRLKFVRSAEELELPLSHRTRFGDLLGHTSAMRQAFHVLERVARTDSSVLIEGESGTGKELAARAVHQHSGRDGSFVAVDCGAIPAGLLESELFGHVRGAFTGAVEHKAGLFSEADGGTIFLDEIGELPLELQPKLLRALETRTVRPLGEADARPFDARLVAATNRNLAQELREGRFREDLFYRLSVFRVRLPPLRERVDEIPRLVAHLLGTLGRDPADPQQRPSEAVMKMLCSHHWPGNVRELRNVVERLAVLPDMAPQYYLGGGEATGGPAQSDGTPELIALPFHEGKKQCVERFERDYLARRLDQCDGNISELARVTGLSRQSCHRLLSRYGLV